MGQKRDWLQDVVDDLMDSIFDRRLHEPHPAKATPRASEHPHRNGLEQN